MLCSTGRVVRLYGVMFSCADRAVRLYGELNGSLHLVSLKRTGNTSQQGSTSALGLCLAGNRDLAVMSVFVVGIQPGTVAAMSGRVRVGDELLEVRVCVCMRFVFSVRDIFIYLRLCTSILCCVFCLCVCLRMFALVGVYVCISVFNIGIWVYA